MVNQTSIICRLDEQRMANKGVYYQPTTAFERDGPAMLQLELSVMGKFNPTVDHRGLL